MCTSRVAWRRMTLFLGLITLPGCDCIHDWFGPGPFSMQVVPEKIIDTIPLQRCVLLVTVDDLWGGCWSGLVDISATAEDADIVIENGTLEPGQVAEVTAIPHKKPDAGEPRTINVVVTGQRSGTQRSATVPITVTSEEEDLVGPLAVEVRDEFIPWLAANRPELGIDANTVWTGTIVTPHILIVTHYLFFSQDWEMHVFWHVMIPPDDWGRIQLRRRFTETKPSLAFEIPSRSATPIQIREIEPQDTLWR